MADPFAQIGSALPGGFGGTGGGAAGAGGHAGVGGAVGGCGAPAAGGPSGGWNHAGGCGTAGFVGGAPAASSSASPAGFGAPARRRAASGDLDDDDDEEAKIGALGRSGREIIQIAVGKAGCGMGHEFLRDLCDEHCIEYGNDMERGTFMGDDMWQEAHLDVFFNEGQLKREPGCRSGRMRWVPRAVLVDLNMQDLASITSGPLGHLYRPENIIGNDEGSGNCYAKAYHLQGADIADDVLELVRKETERCNCLQGLQFTHALAGGTGSGLTGLCMRSLRDYLDRNCKCLFQTFSLVPAPDVKDITLEPYNAALGFQDLVDQVDQCFLFDNAALQDIVQRSLGKAVPKRQEMNNIVALCMSGLTSGLRFKGPLNADLWKLNTSLVPFKNTHFLISSFAPLVADAGRAYRKTSCVLDLAQQMLMKDNVTVKCDPLNPGDAAHDVPRSRILASWASWRGNFRTQEVDRILHAMTKPGSRFDSYYPDWIPNPIASNICKQEHVDNGASVVYVSNNTAVTEVLDHSIQCFDKMIKQGSFLHHFQDNGIPKEDLKEARETIMYVKEMYKDLAKKQDKIIDKGQINERAIENEDHENLAKELKELMKEDMCLTLEMGDHRMRH